MPRQARLHALGILQHVIVKGLEGKEIFFAKRTQGIGKIFVPFMITKSEKNYSI